MLQIGFIILTSGFSTPFFSFGVENHFNLDQIPFVLYISVIAINLICIIFFKHSYQWKVITMSKDKKITRKLKAIMSADVKGYSILMSDDEVLTLKTLNEYRDNMYRYGTSGG